jgi:hypothetical protein
MASTNLISKLKQAPKNDSFRTVDNPAKYNNQIALLNSAGNEQYLRTTGKLISQTDRGTSTLANGKTTGQSILPNK